MTDDYIVHTVDGVDIGFPVNYETEEIEISAEALDNVVDAYIDYLVSEDINVIEALSDITELFVCTCDNKVFYEFYVGGICVYEDCDYLEVNNDGNA